jgi:hypothetical protein
MKNIIFIDQTTYKDSLVGEQLLHLVEDGIYIDGNWCCYTEDLIYDDIELNIALDNMVYLINNYILAKRFQNIIIGWKFDKEIIEKIIKHLNCQEHHVFNFILTNTDLPTVDNFELMDKEYEKNYYQLDDKLIKVSKIDTTEISAFKIAHIISKIITR